MAAGRIRSPLLFLLPLIRPPTSNAFLPPQSLVPRRGVFPDAYPTPVSARWALASTTTDSLPDRYCGVCGSITRRVVPPSDERERSVCASSECGHVTYDNPKVVVGAVCTHRGRVLLCRRAIAPCVGLWGYPQGFLELGETTREGAARETFEEAGATVPDRGSIGMNLLAVYNIGGSQVQMIYRTELDDDQFKAGIESLEVQWFAWDDLPWDELAFPTVGWTLRHAMEGSDGVLERTKVIGADGKWSEREG